MGRLTGGRLSTQFSRVFVFASFGIAMTATVVSGFKTPSDAGGTHPCLSKVGNQSGAGPVLGGSLGGDSYVVHAIACLIIVL